MSSVHICTSETMLAGAIEMTAFCSICCRSEQDILVGYVSSKCKGCGFESSFDGLNETVRSRRKYLGLSVAEMAILAAVKPASVRTYENRWPSKSYWHKTRKLVEAKNGQQ